MKPLVRAEHGDQPALRMENELLRYEVLHLRARLAEAEDDAAKTQRALERLQARTTEADGGQAVKKPAGNARDKDRDEARDDLVWLLSRLDRSPLGPAFRRYGGFRRLRQKYLETPGE